ncbi:hypothetical protein STCU_10654 [Strigomonas culicis]|uniref:Uncharacterized protein n=1 Tax=Strigomonas culicis TaxID=28005 RepID=S9TKN8_9TRYP|nr:hypothetical protein STCU_10654 [Strigomonas culicis]|eukprot:EPY17384.1 hypothetical protein STCU_10654 [Strigomonas culicis]
MQHASHARISRTRSHTLWYSARSSVRLLSRCPIVLISSNNATAACGDSCRKSCRAAQYTSATLTLAMPAGPALTHASTSFSGFTKLPYALTDFSGTCRPPTVSTRSSSSSSSHCRAASSVVRSGGLA